VTTILGTLVCLCPMPKTSNCPSLKTYTITCFEEKVLELQNIVNTKTRKTMELNMGERTINYTQKKL
jgi:hypothetical protein